jgi:triosephosphate isomerase (TIM)
MTPGIRPLIAGNWKMNGTLRDAARLADGVREGVEGVDLLVCPPCLHLHAVAVVLLGSQVAVGAQDCHAARHGAHTGDVSAAMLRDVGATHVILGHSERRSDHAESDAIVLAKTEAALTAGLIPIICVGETEAERLAGLADSVVEKQLAGSIPYGFITAGGIVAYEPVWAIGTGRTPTEADVAAMHALMRQALVERFGPAARTTRLLYGGSVKPANAAGLLALPEVDGALVGGASLVAADFLAIARAVPG